MRRLPRSGSKGGLPRVPGAAGWVDGSLLQRDCLAARRGLEEGGGRKRREEGNELPGGDGPDLTGAQRLFPLVLGAPFRYHDWWPGRRSGKVTSLSSFLSLLAAVSVPRHANALVGADSSVQVPLIGQ